MKRKRFKLGKLWFSPRCVNYFNAENLNIKFRTQDVNLNDPKLEPLFSRMEELGFTLLLHVSDPDLLYDKNYQPSSKYGFKKNHIDALRILLEKYPNLRIVGAHMASQPENLVNLGKWLDAYPNLFVDTGSAKWMVREFSYKKEEVISKKTKAIFKNYPGGHSGFYKDFIEYLYNPRRFIYTPMILCKGMKPHSS